MTGAVGQRRVPIGFIAQSPIPLPPLAEQTRIVSKIEELFSDLDAGEESLRQARRQLGLYRQSLLKQAFEGKLTKAWRAENPDQLESPDQLLARIQTEREERYEKRLKEWKSTVEKWQASGKNSKKPSAPKKPTAIDPINGSELNELAKLPKGWSWFRFGDIVSVRSGEGLTATMMREGDFPVYGGNGISGMHDEFRHVEPRLIIGRVGAKCGVVHITKPKSWVTDNALVADFWIISADMKFFQLLFSFKDLNKQSVSTAQPVVSGAKLNPLPMQFPSLPEQQEIVRLLDAQFTVIEQNEREIDTALKRSEALRQSILKKAFTGQLVPQDPTDEPASVLLARIQAEHESANS
jgi:type I restriction enzyme S subunit